MPIVRRDTGETYRDYVTGLTEASGIEDPTDEDVRKFDKKRKKKTTSRMPTEMLGPSLMGAAPLVRRSVKPPPEAR